MTSSNRDDERSILTNVCEDIHAIWVVVSWLVEMRESDQVKLESLRLTPLKHASGCRSGSGAKPRTFALDFEIVKLLVSNQYTNIEAGTTITSRW